MNGVSSVTTDTTKHSVDIDYDDQLVTIAEMKGKLDSKYYYVSYVNLTAQQANTLLQTHSDAVTVDVRELSEYCDGHIPKATLLPWTSEVFQNNYLTKLPKTGSIVLVCRSGNRSSLAGDFLYDSRFSRNNDVIIYNIEKGMNGWTYPTVKCPKPPKPEASSQPCINYLLLKN